MIRKLLFLFTCALLACRDRLCGHGLAINALAEPPPAAQVSVGLPPGLDPDKVRARKAALIDAGTEPLLAEKLAIEAELQQVARDARNLLDDAKAAALKAPSPQALEIAALKAQLETTQLALAEATAKKGGK